MEQNPIGMGCKGRAENRWVDQVLNDLKKLRVKNWTYIVTDRQAWYEVVQKTRTHNRGLQCQHQQQEEEEENDGDDEYDDNDDDDMMMMMVMMKTLHEQLSTFTLTAVQNTLQLENGVKEHIVEFPWQYSAVYCWWRQ